MPLHAMWVSGHVAQPDRRAAGCLENYSGIDWSDVAGYAENRYMAFRGAANQRVSFTFPIPTPVIIGDVRTRLTTVFVTYDFGTDALVFGVSVYDGDQIIHEFQNLNFTGHHIWPLDYANTFRLPQQHTVLKGIHVNMSVDFHSGPSRDVMFYNAGADFLT